MPTLSPRTFGLLSLALSPLVLLAAPAVSAPSAPTLPQQDGQTHVGARSCAGSSCHGATQSWQRWQDSDVQQNEYVTWQRHDKHAMAYEVLLNERSQKMAENLGLESAHTADLCLDCHADNVPPAQRGATWRHNDGVSCEACHGGARGWLSGHMSSKSHSANLRKGLYPTEDPQARAQLCLSCHGGGDKRVTHRVMGAGHPRISFELDTFSAIQPAHFTVDKDYVRRKGQPSAAMTWAVGQTASAQLLVADLQDPELRGQGMFPELTLFDCHGCHRPMDPPLWQSRPLVGATPGVPQLQDANLLMLTVVAQRLDPALAEALTSSQKGLHAAVFSDATALASHAATLQTQLGQLQGQLDAHTFTSDDLVALLSALDALAQAGELTRYASAEQATMAAGALLSDWMRLTEPDEVRTRTLQEALDGCYATVETPDAWQPGPFAQAMTALSEAVDGSP